MACQYFHTGIIDAIHANLDIKGSAMPYCWLAFKLIEAGARVDIKNIQARTPLDATPLLLQHYEKVYPMIKKYETTLRKRTKGITLK